MKRETKIKIGTVEIIWEHVDVAYIIKVPTQKLSGMTKENNKKTLTCLMTEQVVPAAANKPFGWEWSQGCLQPNKTMQNAC